MEAQVIGLPANVGAAALKSYGAMSTEGGGILHSFQAEKRATSLVNHIDFAIRVLTERHKAKCEEVRM